MSNVLIVYYSRTGTTRKVAAELAAIAGWDLERVIDLRSRDGLVGYLGASVDALLDRRTTLAPSRADPATYDLVVVGTPVWNGSASTPIRTWLEAHAGRLPPLAFFATEGGRGAARAFRKMAAVAGVAPSFTLELRASDLEAGALVAKLAPLVAAVRSLVGRPAPPPPLEPMPPSVA
ncbi:MAG TPA: flavodoxin [Polyangia bacterium]